MQTDSVEKAAGVGKFRRQWQCPNCFAAGRRLIRVVRAVEKVNRFTVFYGTILVIAQDVHVFTRSYVLNLVVMVEFVCHF